MFQTATQSYNDNLILQNVTLKISLQNDTYAQFGRKDTLFFSRYARNCGVFMLDFTVGAAGIILEQAARLLKPSRLREENIYCFSNSASIVS